MNVWYLGHVTMHSIRCGLLLPCWHDLSACLSVCQCVCLLVGLERQLCIMSWTGWVAIWDVDSWWPQNHTLSGGLDPTMEWALWGVMPGHACYPCESFREGLWNHWCAFVCLSVCYHDNWIKRGRIWTKFFGKVPRGKSKPKFVCSYDR